MSEDKKYQAETDFKAIFTTPSRWFGLVYVLLIIAVIIAGRYFVMNIDAISDNTKGTEKLLNNFEGRVDIQQQKGQVLEGVDVMEIGQNPSEDLIAQGKELYNTNCASCHGDNGRGDGPAGAALNPPPRDFHTTDGWTNGRTIADLYKTLEEGIIENGMNAYNYMPVKDRFAIIHYLRTFSDFPEPNEEELSNLDLTYSLSEGKKTNNQITFDKAKDIVSNEKLQNFETIKNRFNNTSNFELFDKITNNKNRALYTLTNINWTDDINKFKSVVYNGIPQNGFNTEVADLTDEEWGMLHSRLVGIFAAN